MLSILFERARGLSKHRHFVARWNFVAINSEHEHWNMMIRIPWFELTNIWKQSTAYQQANDFINWIWRSSDSFKFSLQSTVLIYPNNHHVFVRPKWIEAETKQMNSWAFWIQQIVVRSKATSAWQQYSLCNHHNRFAITTTALQLATGNRWPNGNLMSSDQPKAADRFERLNANDDRFIHSSSFQGERWAIQLNDQRWTQTMTTLFIRAVFKATVRQFNDEHWTQSTQRRKFEQFSPDACKTSTNELNRWPMNK